MPTDGNTGTATGIGSADTGTTAGLKFDLGEDTGTTGAPVDLCKVGGDSGPGMCSDKAPPDAFTPEVQWSWPGMDGLVQVDPPPELSRP